MASRVGFLTRAVDVATIVILGVVYVGVLSVGTAWITFRRFARRIGTLGVAAGAYLVRLTRTTQ